MTTIAIISVSILVLIVGFFVLKAKKTKSTEVLPDSGELSATLEVEAPSIQSDEMQPVAESSKDVEQEGTIEASTQDSSDSLSSEDETVARSDEVASEEIQPLLESEEVDEAPAPSSAGTPPPPPQRESSVEQQERAAQLVQMRKGLARSRDEAGFFGRLKSLFSSKNAINSDLAEEIEEILLTSDVGIETTESLLADIRAALNAGDLKEESKVWETLRLKAKELLDVPVTSEATTGLKVILMVGVNGAGKTTTIGKLAQKYQAEGKVVMMAAGDTFRAAAVDQLKAWGDRIGCEVIAGKSEADPSSVLFDAIDAAKARGADVLLADTAGRLHTKANLMQEMTKIYKTAGKALDGAPHEVFLVIDSTNGQNALAQAREFKEALPLSGLVLTKLDGTARGGVVLGICDALSVPVRFIGMGEGPQDLHEFNASAFVEALLGTDNEEIAA